MDTEHSLNTPQPTTQVLNRRRYGGEFVGPRLSRGRPSNAVAFKTEPPNGVTRGDKTKLNVKSLQNPLFCLVDFLTFGVLQSELMVPVDSDLGGNPFDGSDDSQYINPESEASMEKTDLETFFTCLVPDLRPNEVSMQRTASFDYCKVAFKASYVDPATGELVHCATLGLHVDVNKTTRWIFNLSGTQCRMFDMKALSVYLQKLNAKITRLDLAVDDYEGTRSVDYALDLFKNGKFTARGNNPSYKLITGTDGSTLYLGKRENGKQLCVYQKGKMVAKSDSDTLKELKAHHPNWTRWEVRIGNRDRIIPYAALVDTAAYFLGSHGPFPSIFPDLESATIEKIKTTSATLSAIDIEHTLDCMSNGYGKALRTLRKLGVPDAKILDRVQRPGVQACLGTPTIDQMARHFN